MPYPDIYKVEDGKVLPTPEWVGTFNELRRRAMHDAARPLGNYVASMVIKETNGYGMAETAQAFIDASQPPMTEQEVSGFAGSFLIQAELVDYRKFSPSLHDVAGRSIEERRATV